MYKVSPTMSYSGKLVSGVEGDRRAMSHTAQASNALKQAFNQYTSVQAQIQARKTAEENKVILAQAQTKGNLSVDPEALASDIIAEGQDPVVRRFILGQEEAILKNAINAQNEDFTALSLDPNISVAEFKEEAFRRRDAMIKDNNFSPNVAAGFIEYTDKVISQGYNQRVKADYETNVQIQAADAMYNAQKEVDFDLAAISTGDLKISEEDFMAKWINKIQPYVDDGTFKPGAALEMEDVLRQQYREQNAMFGIRIVNGQMKETTNTAELNESYQLGLDWVDKKEEEWLKEGYHPDTVVKMTTKLKTALNNDYTTISSGRKVVTDAAKNQLKLSNYVIDTGYAVSNATAGTHTATDDQLRLDYVSKALGDQFQTMLGETATVEELKAWTSSPEVTNMFIEKLASGDQAVIEAVTLNRRLPKNMLAQLSEGILSGSDAGREQAYNAIHRLNTIAVRNNDMVMKSGLSKDAQEYYQEAKYYIGTENGDVLAGMRTYEAQRLSVTPEQRAQNNTKLNSKAGIADAETTVDDILDEEFVDTSWFFDFDEVNEGARGITAARTEMLEVYKTVLLNAVHGEGSARARTVDYLREHYGPTAFNGGTTLMKDPPEKMGVGEYGLSHWNASKALLELTYKDLIPEGGGLVLRSHPKTTSTRSYDIIIVDEYGEAAGNLLPVHMFTFDPNVTMRQIVEVQRETAKLKAELYPPKEQVDPVWPSSVPFELRY